MTRADAFGRARLLGLGAVSLAFAGLVLYLVLGVPIVAPHPPDAALRQHQVTAAALYALMALFDVMVVLVVRRSLRGQAASPPVAPPPSPGFVPPAIRVTFDHVTPASVLVTGVVSLGVLVAAAAIGLPIWAVAILTLAPWVPIYVSVARWQFRRYGLYAVFGGVVLLQLGHLSEHLSQCIELIASRGNVAISQGIFGFLNQEAVHFFWNVLILLGTAFLLTRFGRGNPWLWISFFIASFHGVEHFYLYLLYLTDYQHYVLGASAGILAKGGLVPTPLARPYLHLVYNYVEIVPFLLAFWDAGRRLRVASPERRTAGASTIAGRS
jgi:hypothetical protein